MHNFKFIQSSVCSALSLATVSLHAGTPLSPSLSSQATADKSSYSLFNPTPINLLREMSTDRPDQTESPHTVDAGHIQVEMTAVGAAVDRADGARSEEFTFASTNLKFGLLNSVDIQFVHDIWITSQTREGGRTKRVSDPGDLTTRLKINLWGNDEGTTAFALMPYVKFPLSGSAFRNGETESGLIAILGFELPGGWGSAVMAEVDFVSDDNGGYDVEYFLTATSGHNITDKLGCYFEAAALLRPDSGEDWQGQLDFGLTYAVTENFQLDAGCNFGITDMAPDFSPFIGFSARF
jgi:hypothetical protein